MEKDGGRTGRPVVALTGAIGATLLIYGLGKTKSVAANVGSHLIGTPTAGDFRPFAECEGAQKIAVG